MIEPEHPDPAIRYINLKMNAMPPPPIDHVPSKLKTTVPDVLKHPSAKARCGEIEIMLDLGLRLLAGFGTSPDKHRATTLLKRATTTKSTRPGDDDLKATAHALLLESLCVIPRKSRECPEFEILCEGEFHASEAVRLRPGKPFPSNVLCFCKAFERMRHLEDMPAVFGDYDALWEAYKLNREELKKAEERLEEKIGAKPGRYHCAAPGCRLMAEKGRNLKQCAGDCDSEYKPSYCSRECQIRDRPTHKPFCKPGVRPPLTEGNSSLLVGGERIDLVKWDTQAPTLTLPVRSTCGKLFHVSGQREQLKNMEIITTSVPGGQTGDHTVYQLKI